MIALFYARHKEEKKNPPKSDDGAPRGPNTLAAMARGVCLKGAWTGKRMQACKAPRERWDRESNNYGRVRQLDKHVAMGII